MTILQSVPSAYAPGIGREALQVLTRERSLLPALELFHQAMGDIFRVPLPGFSPIFMVGPEANRFVLATDREGFRWRSEGDPVTRLLRQGILVVDGEQHDGLRHAMAPALHKQVLSGYVDSMLSNTDRIAGVWQPGEVIDGLAEMRKIALLILVDTLFGADLQPDLDRLWKAILKVLAYISPGPWIIWPGIPRPGYQAAIHQMDRYLYQLIEQGRQNGRGRGNLIDLLSIIPGMDEKIIRDQLLTMLIAGHDTSTALLSWTMYLLTKYPESMERVRAEIDDNLGSERVSYENINRLQYLDLAIKETLRLYPPIHIGLRTAKRDLEFQGFRIPAGSRVAYSIYLSHRQPQYWSEPARFDPERFLPERSKDRPAYTYIPFGGGPRNCFGMAFAQVEVKVVLARLLQRCEFELVSSQVKAHMGATLEPRGLKFRVKPR